MNQQQFSKYLNGVSKPSAHNLRKIAVFFGVADVDFDLPHDSFVALASAPKSSDLIKPEDSLKLAFPGNLRALRGFVGRYRVYYTSPAVPARIVVSAMFLNEKDGMIYTRSIESLRAEGESQKQRSRCDGQASYHSERLFVVDFEERNGGALSMTALVPPHRYRQGLIFGMMFFIASYPRRTPHASRIVWQRVEERHSVKELLQGCGSYQTDSLKVHPAIRKYLTATANQMSVSPPFEAPG